MLILRHERSDDDGRENVLVEKIGRIASDREPAERLNRSTDDWESAGSTCELQYRIIIWHLSHTYRMHQQELATEPLAFQHPLASTFDLDPLLDSIPRFPACGIHMQPI